MQTLGLLFENLVIRDLLVFLSTFPGIDNRLFYYRDEKGLETDAVIESGGRWAAQIQLSDTKADEAAENLKALRRKVLSLIMSGRIPSRLFLPWWWGAGVWRINVTMGSW